MALTTEQLLLLENLTYFKHDEPLISLTDALGLTIKEVLAQIDTSKFEERRVYGGCYIIGRDWKNIFRAIRKDAVLMNMVVSATHIDTAAGGGGGFSVVFLSRETGEAVVAFQGTAGEEWLDDFIAGNMTDTSQQKNALEWYQRVYDELSLSQYEVTVIGHSKGGNKAKYITILDPTVSRCVAFDGQGFSDEFMEEYAGEIARRQRLIQNHNLDYDYVNLLLNDIGEKTFYVGQEVDSFLENHGPSSFLAFGEDGDFSLVVNPEGQAKEMMLIDDLLNNMLRSMPELEQDDILFMLGAIMQSHFAGRADLAFFKEILLGSQYMDNTAYFLAYLVKYSQFHPHTMDYVRSVLCQFEMHEAVKYIDWIDKVIHNRFFDLLISAVNWTSGHIPRRILRRTLNYLRQNGVEVTEDEAGRFLKVLSMIHRFMLEIVIEDNGMDIVIPYEEDPSQRAEPCEPYPTGA